MRELIVAAFHPSTRLAELAQQLLSWGAASACSTTMHKPRAFTLEKSISTPGGVLISRYVRSGEVRTGSFAAVGPYCVRAPVGEAL
ncbi:hypothetical protein D3C75_1114550 [compost metagenome]